MTSPLKRGLKILEKREVKFADRFIPYFFITYADHCFNLMNKRRQIYFEHGRRPDFRCHCLMVAPPGFSKSFYMRNCFDPEFGILYTSKVKTTFEGSCTEAGWTGSISGVGQSSVKSVGLAEEYKDGIVAIEEFTAITKAMRMEHSLGFEAQLNSSLFGGNVKKRLRSGTISYQTNVSLIAGTQPTRFEMGGGLPRRINFINWIPTSREFSILRKAIRNGTNIPPDVNELVDYRNRISDWIDDLDSINHLDFSDEFYDFLGERPHYELLLYKKIALGYTLFSTWKQPSEIIVKPDRELKILLLNAMKWRDELLSDPEGEQVIQVVKDNNGKLPKLELKHLLTRYHMNYETSEKVINRLLWSGHLRRARNGDICLPFRRVEVKKMLKEEKRNAET